MAQYAAASICGACILRLEVASQLDGESLTGPATLPDRLALLSLSVSPHTDRRGGPIAVSSSCKAFVEAPCAAGAICS